MVWPTLHSELLKSDVLKDFTKGGAEIHSNKTHGVSPSRWMVLELSELASSSRSTSATVDKDLRRLRGLKTWRTTTIFAPVREIKHATSRMAARATAAGEGHRQKLDVRCLVTRIHAYKRPA